jgi:CelD/BcsL family acetyltransferase involved in cellulose biosynthesis
MPLSLATKGLKVLRGMNTEMTLPITEPLLVGSAVSSDNLGDLDIYAASTPDAFQGVKDLWERANIHPDADREFYALLTSLRPEFIKPFILVAAQGGTPRALLVGRLENSVVPLKLGYFTFAKIPVRQITIMQDGLLGNPSPAVTRAMVTRISRCLKEGLADRAWLHNAGVESELYHCARSVPAALCRDHAPDFIAHWRTALPASLDEFLKRRSKKHRYWLRRIIRVFEDEHKGKVEYKIVTKPEQLDEFCAAAETVAASTYQRGLGVGFANTEETRRRLQLAAEKGWLRAYLICVDGKPLAFWGGRLYNSVMYLEWTGYNPAYRKFELGTVLFLKMIEDLCRSGVREMDYGTGASVYKERFGDNSRPEASLCIYAPTFKSVCIGLLKAGETLLNRSAKAVAKRLKVMDQIKKRWRGRLAGGTASTESQSGSEEAESA